MDSVSTLNQVVGLLRQQIAERNRSTDRTPLQKGAGARASRADQHSPDARATLDERIWPMRAGGINDPERLSRTVIEWLLAREFGTSIVNDPEFQQMVDQVNECILDDQESADRIEQFLTRAAI